MDCRYVCTFADDLVMLDFNLIIWDQNILHLLQQIWPESGHRDRLSLNQRSCRRVHRPSILRTGEHCARALEWRNCQTYTQFMLKNGCSLWIRNVPSWILYSLNYMSLFQCFQKRQVQDLRLSYLFCSHHQVICHNSPPQCVLNAVIVEPEQTQLLTRQNFSLFHAYWKHFFTSAF